MLRPSILTLFDVTLSDNFQFNGTSIEFIFWEKNHTNDLQEVGET